MRYFAGIKDNIVEQVYVVSNEDANLDINKLKSILQTTNILIETFYEDYNTNPRKNFSVPGFTYNQDLDCFIAPKPHNSWILNEDNCQWEAPISIPDAGMWKWNEETLSWIEI
jgi:hypothetical protein